MRRKTHTRLTVLVVAAIGALLLALTASALARDRNNDRIPDRWERKHGLSLKKKQGKRDQDRDKLRNRGEFRADMVPRDEDTDDDGIEDGDENAGVVASFDSDTGLLTIDLFNGPDVSGLVTDETEIECEGEGDEDEEGPNEPDEDNNANDDEDEESEDDEEESGDDDSDATDSSNGDEEVACSIADVAPGAVVHEAELELTGAGAVFEEIELVK